MISLSKIHSRTQIPLNFCQHKMTKIKIPLQILLNSYGMIIILQFFATMKISHRDHRKLQKICSTKKLLPYATTHIYSTKKGVFSVIIIIMSYCDSKCSKLSHKVVFPVCGQFYGWCFTKDCSPTESSPIEQFLDRMLPRPDISPPRHFPDRTFPRPETSQTICFNQIFWVYLESFLICSNYYLLNYEESK